MTEPDVINARKTMNQHIITRYQCRACGRYYETYDEAVGCCDPVSVVYGCPVCRKMYQAQDSVGKCFSAHPTIGVSHYDHLRR